MKYVLDASVAIRWVIPRPLTPKAVRLRDAYQRPVHELLAPAGLRKVSPDCRCKPLVRPGLVYWRGSLYRGINCHGYTATARESSGVSRGRPGEVPRAVGRFQRGRTEDRRRCSGPRQTR